MVVLATVLAALLVPLNSTMISVALPQIATSLDVSISTINWLVTVYLIGTASLQPVAGKLGDRFGRRPVLLAGLVAFGLSSVVAMFAMTLPLLIVCRVVQAMSGALLMPTGMAIMRDAVPAEKLGRIMGLLGAIIPIATAAGPALGGILLSAFGWQAIFTVNVPLAAVAVVFGFYALPRSHRSTDTSRFDLAGSLMLCAMLIVLTLLLDQTPGVTIATLGGVLLAATATVFVRHELRHADAVLHPRLFTHRGFLAGSVGIMLSNLAFYITLLAIPMLLDRWDGVSQTQSGLILAALTIGSSPLSLLGGRLADKAGQRLPGMLGLVLITVGIGALSVTVETISTGPLVALLAITGAGVGLSMPALQLAAVNSVSQQDTGSALGVFFTLRYLGSIIGTSLLTGPLALPEVGTHGFGRLFTVLAIVALLGIAVTGLLPGRQPKPVVDAERTAPEAETHR